MVEYENSRRFEFHSHSHYSKGTKIVVEGLPQPKEIIDQAKRIGLRGIAITDHDNSQCWREAKAEAKKQDIIFIPAIEIMSSSGHILGLGLTEHVKKDMDVSETIDAIREQGGVAIAAHPFDAQDWGIRKHMDKADAVEVFNALGVDRIGNMAAERRARKKGLNMVAGSDAHSLEMIGTACNLADADSLDEILHAIRHGNLTFERNYMSNKVMIDWIRERLIESYPQIMSYINSHYHGPKAWIAKKMLNNYVISGNRFWERFSTPGVAIATIYSALRIMAYY